MAKYLYNEIELPALPEYDTEAYPYAYIGSTNNTRYYLYVSALPFYVRLRGYTATLDTSQGLAFFATTTTGAWSQETDVTQFTSGSMCAYPVWTNHDIYYTDDYTTDETLAGTLYLAASDPVPVGGEPEQPDPLHISPYLPKNGAWVKHDIYKQVGNTWVKQPQGAVEVEDGAWQGLS